MKIPLIQLLETPSGATVELEFRSIKSIRFSAKLIVNNTVVANVYGTHTAIVDGNDLVLNEAHIRLLPDSVIAAQKFLRMRANKGGES